MTGPADRSVAATEGREPADPAATQALRSHAEEPAEGDTGEAADGPEVPREHSELAAEGE